MTLSSPAIGLAHRPTLHDAEGASRPSTDARGPASDVTTVADVMSADPVGIDPLASLFGAAVRMRSSGLSEIPVVDSDGNLVGVLKARDLAREVAVPAGLPEIHGLLDVLMIGLYDQPVTFFAQLRTLWEETTVKEAMSPRPATVPADLPIEAAMGTLKRCKTDRAIVVDQGRVVGIVTASDLLLGAVRRPAPRSSASAGRGRAPRRQTEGGPR